VRQGRLRRWWWRWRLGRWERKLHRLRSKLTAWLALETKVQIEHKGKWISRYNVEDELGAEIADATYKVTLLRNLLNEMPVMQLLDGGKEDDDGGELRRGQR
jgi:hypothetical protein